MSGAVEQQKDGHEDGTRAVGGTHARQAGHRVSPGAGAVTCLAVLIMAAAFAATSSVSRIDTSALPADEEGLVEEYPFAQGAQFPAFFQAPLRDGALLIGDPKADVELVVLFDPTCAASHRIFRITMDLLRSEDHEVRAAFQPLPLDADGGWAGAFNSASRCATQQNAQLEFLSTVFATPTSFLADSRDWVGFAQQARVPDPDAFAACMSIAHPMALTETVRRALIQGYVGRIVTPLFMLDRRLYAGAPSEHELRGLVRGAVRSSTEHSILRSINQSSLQGGTP